MVRRTSPIAQAVALLAPLLLLAASPAAAQVVPAYTVEFVDRGVPTDGTLVMTGYRGVVIRVRNNYGYAVTRFNFGGVEGQGGGVEGYLAQRWTDPTGSSTYYAYGAPGVPAPFVSPLAKADNTAPDEFNFDSHFLDDGTVFANHANLGELAPSLVLPPPLFFGSLDTTAVPVASTPFVGYGRTGRNVTGNPASAVTQAKLVGLFEVLPEHARDPYFDVAYAVTNSTFFVAFSARAAETGTVGVGVGATYSVPVPEPAGLAALIAAAATALMRRRRPRGRPCIDPLEPRAHLDGGESENLVSADLTFTQTSDGLRVDWSSLQAPADRTSRLVLRRYLDYGVADTDSLVDQTIPFDQMGDRTHTSHFVDHDVGPGQRVQYVLEQTSRVRPDFPIQFPPQLVAADAAWIGLDAAPQHNKGRVLILADQTMFATSRGPMLREKLARLTRDLVAEGWAVTLRDDAPRADPPRSIPQAVKDAAAVDPDSQVVRDWLDDPTNSNTAYRQAVAATKQIVRAERLAHADLKAVLIFGHVAVPYSGNYASQSAPDGHVDHVGAWPTDRYYGSMAPETAWPDGEYFPNVDRPPVPTDPDAAVLMDFDVNYNFPGDGKFDRSTMPDATPGDLVVSRVDFAGLGLDPTDLSEPRAAPATAAEVERLEDYLDRNHAYRTDAWDVQRAALVDPASRAISSNLGLTDLAGLIPDPIGQGGTSSTPPSALNRANHDLNNASWLWFLTGGEGRRTPTGREQIVLDAGVDRVLQSTDFYGGSGEHHSVFNSVLPSSYVGDFDKRNGLLRSMLAQGDAPGGQDGSALVAFWQDVNKLSIAVNRDGHSHANPMSVGGTTADLMRTAFESVEMNGTHHFVLGDLTLRQDYFPGATDANVFYTEGVMPTELRWTASPDPDVTGYYLYHGDDDGTLTLLNGGQKVQGTSFVLGTNDPVADAGRYVVRAARLEETAAGSYENLAAGAVAAYAPARIEFDTNGRVPTPADPYKQDVTLSFGRPALLAGGDVTIAGRRLVRATDGSASLVSETLVEGIHFALLEPSVPGTTRRVVFLRPPAAGNPTQPIEQRADIAPSGIWTLTLTPAGGAYGERSKLDFLFLAGDADNDQDVDFEDLLMLSANSGVPQTPQSNDAPTAYADFNADGVVNFIDLLMLSEHYGIDLWYWM